MQSRQSPSSTAMALVAVLAITMPLSPALAFTPSSLHGRAMLTNHNLLHHSSPFRPIQHSYTSFPSHTRRKNDRNNLTPISYPSSSSLHMLPPADGSDSLPSTIFSSIFSTIVGALAQAADSGEAGTVSILLAGFGTITWFLTNEYLYLKDKSDKIVEVLNSKGGRGGKDGKEEGGGDPKDFTWVDLIDYRLDYFFSSSSWAKVILLLGLSYVLVVFGAGLLVIADANDYGTISEAAWTSWTYVVDPGAQADAPEDFVPRAVSLFVTVGGLLIFALLIGIVGESIGEYLDDLKTGKSRVLESDHTLMLNWNDKSIAVIQQIALANESEGGGTVVILSQLEKEEMEEKLNAAQSAKENPLELLGTEVVCRQGNPISENDLKRVSATTARSIIALTPPDSSSDEADANMLRQVLALKALDNDFGKDGDSHVVVELQDVDNKDLIKMVAPEFAEVIVNHDMIGRLMLQCARTPELAFVLDSMMGFEGSEFYFAKWPELYGKTFYEITCRFDDAIPVGLRSVEGIVRINPENDDVYKEGEEILVLAEDDDTYEVNDGSYSPAADPCSDNGKECKFLFETPQPEKILFCGWRRDMADLISQLDEYVPPESELWLFNTIPANKRKDRLLDEGNKAELKLKNLSIKNAVGNPIIRRDLNRIWDVDNAGNLTGDKITLDEFDSMLILSDETAMKGGDKGSTSSDSKNIAAVLIITDMMEKMYNEKKAKSSTPQKIKPPCIPVSEILDTRTKSLLTVANCKGYVMSNEIISSVVAQVAEEKDINVVLTELFSASGSETYIRDVTRFVDLSEGDEISFWDVALKARQDREIALGYKPAELEYTDAEDSIINPPDKSKKRKWSKGDKIITLSLGDDYAEEPPMSKAKVEENAMEVRSSNIASGGINGNGPHEESGGVMEAETVEEAGETKEAANAASQAGEETEKKRNDLEEEKVIFQPSVPAPHEENEEVMQADTVKEAGETEEVTNAAAEAGKAGEELENIRSDLEEERMALSTSVPAANPPTKPPTLPHTNPPVRTDARREKVTHLLSRVFRRQSQ